LPLYPDLSDEEVEYVIEAIREFHMQRVSDRLAVGRG
jgi:dTDP-4-amino-4,6-dideoxygalactose transaminase